MILTGGWLAGFALLARLPGLAARPGSGENRDRAQNTRAENPEPAGHLDPPENPEPVGDPAPDRLSVVIPARNEEGNLGNLLGSLARQRPAPDEVIVVDDRSTDGTAGLARRAGATVLAGTDPPPGWTGKCWACHQGAAVAGGKRLVFLDADVTLGPDALARLVAEHDGRRGLVSVAPFHHTERPYEALSAVANLVALMGTGAFSVFPSQPTMAFGPCLITGVDEYRRAGGHAHPEVRGAVTEDVALGGRFRAVGLPVAVLAGRDAVSFRMYPGGPRQLVDGWTRLLAYGAQRTPAPIGGAIALWITAALLAASGPLRARGRRDAWAWYGAFSLQMWWMLRRTGRFGALGTLAFPLPLSTFVALFARSTWHRVLGRPPTWRGRTMPPDTTAASVSRPLS